MFWLLIFMTFILSSCRNEQVYFPLDGTEPSFKHIVVDGIIYEASEGFLDKTNIITIKDDDDISKIILPTIDKAKWTLEIEAKRIIDESLRKVSSASDDHIQIMTIDHSKLDTLEIIMADSIHRGTILIIFSSR